MRVLLIFPLLLALGRSHAVTLHEVAETLQDAALSEQPRVLVGNSRFVNLLTAESAKALTNWIYLGINDREEVVLVQAARASLRVRHGGRRTFRVYDPAKVRIRILREMTSLDGFKLQGIAAQEKSALRKRPRWQKDRSLELMARTEGRANEIIREVLGDSAQKYVEPRGQLETYEMLGGGKILATTLSINVSELNTENLTAILSQLLDGQTNVAEVRERIKAECEPLLLEDKR